MGWTVADMPDMTGRLAVVTGANGGLGLETARGLAGAGATVVMAARRLDEAEAAAESIREGHPEASLDLVNLDLASLDSVRTAAATIGARHGSIDVLVANAGLMGIPHQRTVDGFEMQFGVNHLGHFALTALLWPQLVADRGARVVTVTSFARVWRSRFDREDPPLRGGYGPWKAYGLSKMANLRFALELDRRARAADVPVAGIVVHPGLAHTRLQVTSVRESRGGITQRFWAWAARTAGMSPRRGALPVLRAASDPTARGGHFYAPRFVTSGPPVRRPLLPWNRRSPQSRALWEASERMTGIDFGI
jgi:NAD(P)-dependent dehydrogenase (short-subunit alcohol dehydrogenase family)